MAGELMSAGLTNVRVVPRTADIWYGINHAQQMFTTLEFRSPECDAGLEALEAYHTKETREGGIVSDEPVHDWSSHASDAFRTMAEAHSAGMFKFSYLDLTGVPDLYDQYAKKRRRGVKPLRAGG